LFTLKKTPHNLTIIENKLGNTQFSADELVSSLNIELSDEVVAELLPIVEQMLEGDKSLSGTDLTQLGDLAAVIERQREMTSLLNEARANGDTKNYLSIGRLADSLASTKRSLLKDMVLTRASTSESSVSKVASKAQAKSGRDWSGIL